MGHSEETTTSLGVRIKCINLYNNLNEETFDFIRRFVSTVGVVIIDSNETKNEDFSRVENESCVTIEDLEKMLRFWIWNDDYIAIPIKQICHTERWGYSREGINSNYSEFDIDELNKAINDATEYASRFPELNGEVIWLTVQESG